MTIFTLWFENFPNNLPALFLSLGVAVLFVVIFVKTWVVVFVISQLRWTMPRIRVDQMMSLCWKVLVPLSFVAMLAIQLEGQGWSQFLFGGLMVFVVTQLYGIELKRWQRFALSGIVVLGAAVYYGMYPDKVGELWRLFLTRYGAVFITALIIWLIMRPFIWSGKRVPGVTRMNAPARS